MVAVFPKNEIEAICICGALSLGHYSLWEYQKDVVTNVVTGNDAFAVSNLLRQLRVCATDACLPGTFYRLCHYEFKNCKVFPTHLARFPSD